MVVSRSLVKVFVLVLVADEDVAEGDEVMGAAEGVVWFHCPLPVSFLRSQSNYEWRAH